MRGNIKLNRMDLGNTALSVHSIKNQIIYFLNMRFKFELISIRLTKLCVSCQSITV